MNRPPDSVAPRPAMRRFAIAVLRIGVAIGILAFLFRRVRIIHVRDVLSGAESSWVAAAFASSMALQWLVASRLRRLVRTQDLAISTFDAFEINLTSRFYGLFLPGGNMTSIAVRVLKLVRITHSAVDTGVAIATDRLAATATLCLLGILFWFVELPDQGRAWMVLVGLVLFGIVVFTALLLGRGTVAFLERMGVPHLGGLHDARVRIRSLGRADWRDIFLLSIAAHLVGICTFWMLGHALGLRPGLLSMGWIRTCILLPTLIPISVAGLGLREGAAVLLLGMLGVPEERALAFGLLIFAVTVFGVGLAGGILEGRRWLMPPSRRNRIP